MKITTQRINGNCFFILEKGRRTMTVLTKTGKVSELAQEAEELIEKAARYTRQAEMIQEAVRQIKGLKLRAFYLRIDGVEKREGTL